ncbi:MAG: YiiX/YebB-like N1pC/P60 family cysteine hydrolase [Hyphomicrobiaceae bacterium]
MKTTGCPKLDADLTAFWSLTEERFVDAATFSARLEETSKLLKYADLGAYDADAIRAHADDALDDMFELKLALRERVPEWQALGLMNRDVQRALRGIFRDSRYVTDMLGELITGRSLSPGRGVTTQMAFTGGPLQVSVNPRYGRDTETVSFEPGDVLLVRGMEANSAAIARIGDVDSQFSHVALISQDQAGQIDVVESLIAVGATISTLKSTLGHDLVRVLLLRPRDRELGLIASTLIRAHVERSLAGPLPRIPYNFGMELDDYSSLFCSQLVRLAYALASDGAVQLPMFATRLDLTNRTFFEQIGVTARETFAPADVEIDPFFDVVAEWRDYRFTAYIRMQDVVMDAIFWWMETENYAFREPLSIEISSLIAKGTAYLPDPFRAAIRNVMPEIPRNMSRTAVAAVTMLHFTAKPLADMLMAEHHKLMRETGRPLHPVDAFAILERHRLQAGRRVGMLYANPVLV